MNKKKLLRQIINNKKNVRYNDFTALAESFGFILQRSEGSHRMYKHKAVAEILNLQSRNGEAKPYQIEYFFGLVEKYNLEMED